MKINNSSFIKACSTWLFLFVAIVIQAQPDHDGPPPEGNQKEKIESLRRAYYTKELALTPNEAEKFWPIYHEFEEVKQQHRKNLKKLHDQEVEQIQTTADLENFTKKLGALKEQESQQLLDYLKKCQAAIGLEKTKRLITIDEKFKKEMADRLKERKQNSKGQSQKRKR